MAEKSGTLALRSAIVNTLACEIQNFSQVVSHGGRMTTDDLENYAYRTPTLFVTVNGHGDISHEGGQRYAVANVEVWIVASDQRQLKRDAAVLNLADLVIKESVLNVWGFDCGVQVPFGMSSRNNYHPKLDECNLSMWVISWTQKVDLELVDADALDAFEDVLATYEQNETADDTTDIIPLDQV